MFNLFESLDYYLFPRPDILVSIDPAGIVYSLPQMVHSIVRGLKPYSGTVAYHYADRNTWPLIAKNRELWMTDYTALLDPSEGIYGLPVIYKMLVFREGNSDNLTTLKVRSSLKNWLIHGLSQSQFYVSSLSSNPDDIGLWRAYSNAGGVALGVSLDSLTAFLRFDMGFKSGR